MENEKMSSNNLNLDILQSKITTTSIINAINEVNNWDDCIHLIMRCYKNEEYRFKQLELIYTYKKKGNLQEFLSNNGDNFIIELKSRVLSEFSEFMRMQDSLTAVSFLDMNTYNTGVTWGRYNHDTITDKFREGKFSYIYGVPDSGKTHFAVLIIELLLKKKYNVITNINITSKHENLHIVKDILTALEIAISNKRSVLILDEMSIFYNKKKAMSKSNINIEILMKLFRKFHLSFCVVNQDAVGITPLMQNFAEKNIIFFKGSKKTVKIKESDFNVSLSGVPETKLVFDTYDIGYFKMDMDLSSLLQIADNKNRGKFKERLQELKERGRVKKSKSKDDLELERKISILVRMREKGLSYSDISKELRVYGFTGYSKSNLVELYQKNKREVQE